jgi:uncharacterized protein (DUF927 family)
MAAEANDGFLPIDEVGQADPKEADGMSYMLANDTGKARMSRSLTAREPLNWRISFLSSGEVSLSDKISEGGRKVRAGQKVRVADVPADAGAGMGVFEDMHGFASADAFARYLRTASEQHVGHAAPAFLTDLTKDIAGAMDRLAEARRDWLERNLPAGADGQVSRVAARFGLAAAVGELGAAWGILPWPEGEAERAATACLRAWLRERGGIGAGEARDGIAQIRAFIEANGSSRFELWQDANERGAGIPLADAKTINRAGFRRLVPGLEGDAWEYAILGEVWRKEVCAGRNAQEIAREMAATGWLRRQDNKHLTCKEPVPGHWAPRMYCITPEFLATGEGDL